MPEGEVKMKRLIVNADDFGFSAGCNKGIIQAMESGIVTSATIMATGEALPAAAGWAAAGKPVGLHLCLTYGRPVLPPQKVSSLLDAKGVFLRPDKHTAPDPLEVEIEWRAQIELVRSLGMKPDHLDSHHYMHEMLGTDIFAVAVGLAKEMGVPLRQTTAAGREACRKEGVATTDFFTRDFYGEGATLATLAAILSRPWEGVLELMCHPALPDRTLYEKSSYTDLRAQELDILLSQEARRLVEDNGIELINFSYLGAEHV